jgi:hypothetical protein
MWMSVVDAVSAFGSPVLTTASFRSDEGVLGDTVPAVGVPVVVVSAVAVSDVAVSVVPVADAVDSVVAAWGVFSSSSTSVATAAVIPNANNTPVTAGIKRLHWRKRIEINMGTWLLREKGQFASISQSTA